MRPSPANNKKRQVPYGNKRIPLADAFDELDFEYVTGVAEKAMGAITTQRVPPTPHNFHVWFKYALGTPVELKLISTEKSGAAALLTYQRARAA